MNYETEQAYELFSKALHNAVAWQNRCVDLWEIIEMFCLDAEAEKHDPVVCEKCGKAIKDGKVKCVQGRNCWVGQQPAQRTEQEPVAWNRGVPPVHPQQKEGETFIVSYEATKPRRTEQEPVIDKSAAIRIATALGWEPKREWVGLMDEEMHECWDSPLTPLGMKHARTIEAKLKQKNGYAEENT